MPFPRWFKKSWLSTGPSFEELRGLRLILEDVTGLTDPEKAALQRMCMTDLRFLVSCVLKPASRRFLDFKEEVHGRLVDSFLKPRDDAPYDEWSPVKERVSLAFRGALKSTIVGAFLTQVVLCDPNIRVQVLSGKLPHAKTIMALGRQPFYSNQVLRALFPHFAIGNEAINSDQFTCPARDPELNLRDPTYSVATFDSVKAGGHYELLVFDDCTNEINCSTEEQVEKNEGHYDDTDGLVEPGGYRHFFGTRWADDDTDLPQVIKKRGEEYFAQHGVKNTEYLEIPVWMLRKPYDPEVQARDMKNELRFDDVELTWPEKLGFSFLWPKYRAKPQKFNGQYLLRWQAKIAAESFSRALLDSCTRPYAEGMPKPHDRFLVVNWDMGGVYTGKRTRAGYDGSTALAAMFELSTRRLFIYDSIMEVFNSSTDAAGAIVSFYARQMRIGPVGVCRIEDAFGVRMLEGELRETAKRANVPLQIFWDSPENIENAKNIRIAMLGGAVRRGLVQFSSVLPNRDKIFGQFENWRPMKTGSKRKDDGPDCAAQIWKAFNQQIFPNTVPSLQSSGNEYAPEIHQSPDYDPQSEERECADIGWMQSMTVPHA